MSSDQTREQEKKQKFKGANTAATSDRVRIGEVKLLSDDWYILRKTTFELRRRDGTWQTMSRETYDRGNGAAVLLYNRDAKTVILTRQFRYPAFVNGSDGFLIEACAGIIDQDDPDACARRETEEESGYRVTNLQRVFTAFMSPGSVTEKLYFYIGEYSDEHRASHGGGLHGEGEDIEVLEMTLDDAMHKIATGEIADAKTIMLLQHLKLSRLLE